MRQESNATSGGEVPSFLEDESLLLRPLRLADDVLIFQRWFNDPKVRRSLLTWQFPVTLEEESRWLTGVNEEDRISLLIVRRIDKRPLGTVGLHSINWIDGTARTFTVIGESSEWGKGIGSSARSLVIAYAFLDLNLRKLSSHFLASNYAALRLNKKAGFCEEGRLREHIFREGKYEDVLVYSLLRSEWHEFGFEG